MSAVVTAAPDGDGRDRRYCGAKKRQGEGTCTRPAGWGTDHVGYGTCKLHGGKTSSGIKAAAVQEAHAKVALFGARRDIHPAEALLELVQWTAGEVDFWRQQVRALDAEALTWGKTRFKDGGQDVGTTYEAKPNIAYVMLVDASKRLESHAAAALKAGVEERRVRLAENAGELVAGVIRAVLDQLDLSPSQLERVPTVVPAALRALGPGA